MHSSRPSRSGLYDPGQEKDSCGVGFVAHIKGLRSHQIVLDAEQVLRNMKHRGGCGCERNTGDGAGMLTALPDQFLRRVTAECFHRSLPARSGFGAGLVFLPVDAEQRQRCKEIVNGLIEREGQTLIGWRSVPVDREAADLGPTARQSEPVIEQLIVAGGASGRTLEGDALERKLYLIRKQASRAIREASGLSQRAMFFVCSLSTKVMIYKGMLTPSQLLAYYPDLQAEDYTTHLAMVHSRFSTNTFPSWDRAQPNRFMSHNGEINTLKGNINWMKAREGVAHSELFGEELGKAFPVVEPDCSDSGSFDNVLEFLLMNGRTLQEAVMMMIPEAWEKHDTMPENKRAFYEYHSCVMEPWDGPASIAFTNGQYIGAVLDRNGLRPSRYYVTSDDRVIMASEVGVLPVDPAIVVEKGRLQPGRMFLVDFERGCLIPDRDLKEKFSNQRPYGLWLREGRIELQQVVRQAGARAVKGFDPTTLLPRMRVFGYTVETMHFMLAPLVKQQRDPVGSMGNDAALACLSDQPRLIYDYFKQLFAQVTNPAIDSIREEIIMSLECYIGPERNLLTTSPDHCRRILVPHPILTNEELAALKASPMDGWRSRTIDITFPRAEGEGGMLACLDRVCREAEEAVDQGDAILVMTDRAVGPDRVPVSSLLACGAVHQHLVRQAKRTRVGLVLESGEAREVHHHCLLVGFGADAINPYLAFESLFQARLEGLIPARKFPDDDNIVARYRKAVAKGMLKVMAKMGISTLRSYKGAQIFEALGLRDEVIERCFTGTPSRVQGVDFAVLAQEALRRHDLAYPDGQPVAGSEALENPGEFHWRAEGERHAWDPMSIADIQVAAQANSVEAYRRFADRVDQHARQKYALRGLLRFKPLPSGPVPLEEVQPASEIVKRFCTGAMSYGSITR